MKSENLTAHVVSSHDPEPPKLPPLPEAIVLVAKRGATMWSAEAFDSAGCAEDFARVICKSGPAATRILTISQPQPPREVTDAEVAAIIRENYPRIVKQRSDGAILDCFAETAACVRAALRKAGGK
ncbi:MAG: hypothetical protein KF805_12640 [Phycisphaeraceae bacterium]|nr:hypothetical protein [Phycisphaeraceae bacterium]